MDKIGEIFKLFGSIGLNTTEADKGLDNITKKAKNVGETLSGIGTAMQNAGKAMTGAITVPVLGAVTASIMAFADLEQAVGGIETMFKSSADAVIKNSETAYRRAGVSGTDYMEQVTSFSATLLQGLGGDTERAAKYADTAMVDMSDNANKFGTNIDSIQDAYQGFAKDNYTMLDNLKLGYGGTAGEMARLINESGVLGDTMEATAENVNDIPFHVMVEAIHEIQNEMGVTGTTVLEAEETVSGSFGMMKASLQDLAAGFGQENANMEMLMGNLADSIGYFVDNIKRVLGNMWDNLPLAEWQKWVGLIVVGAGPILVMLGTLIGVVGKVATAFSGAGSIMGGVAALFPNISAGLGLLGQAFGALTGPVGLAIAAIAAIVGVLVYLYNTNETVRNAIDTAWNWIKNVIVTVSQAVAGFVEQIWGRIQSWLQENQQLIQDTIETVWSFIRQIIEDVMAVVVPIVQNAWEAIQLYTQIVWELIKGYVQVGLEFILGLIKIVMQLINGDWEGAWNTVMETAVTIWNIIKSRAEEIWGLLKEYFGEVVSNIVTTISEWFQQLPGKLQEVWNSIVSAVTEWATNMWNKAKETGSNFVSGVIDFVNELPYKLGYLFGQALGHAIKWAVDMWNKAKETGSKFLQNVVTFFQQLPGRIWGFLTSAYNRAVTWASQMWNKAREAGSRFITNIINYFQQLPGRIWTWLQNTIQRVIRFGNDLRTRGREAGGKLVDAVISAVTSLPGKMLTFGKDVVRGFWNGITSLGGWIRKNVGGFFQGIVDGVSSVFQFGSPSRLFKQFGEWVDEGFGEGIDKGARKATGPLKKLMNDMLSIAEDEQISLKPLEWDTTVSNGGSYAQGSDYASASSQHANGGGRAQNTFQNLEQWMRRMLEAIERMGGQPIYVEVDGRTIAVATRDPMDEQLGYKARDDQYAKGRKGH